MKPDTSADRWLALFFLAFAIVLIFVWVPLDTGSGLVEKVRRKFVIGDALGPSVAGAIILFGALLVFARSVPGKALSRANAAWRGRLLLLFVGSLLVMRYAGPLAFSGTEAGYRRR